MRTFWSILVLIMILTTGAQAQILENSFHLNPTAATLTNPAFQHSEDAFELSLGLAVEADSNSWNPALISRYGNKDFNEADKDVILKATNSKQLHLSLAGEPYLGIKYDWFGVRASGRVVGNGQVPSEVLHLALKGNELNKEYQLSDLNGEAAGYLEAAIIFAAPIDHLFDNPHVPEITVAASAKYLHGLAFGRFEGEATVETKLADGVAQIIGNGQGTYAYSRSGSGFALDLGISTTLSDKLKVDASILNLGAITWRDVEQGSASMDVSVDPDDFENAKFDYELAESAPGSDISWKIPRTFRIGVAYQVLDQLTVLADLSLNKSEAMSLTSRQVVGVEYRPWDFMPIQAALVKQSQTSLRLDLGWGLEFSNFELGVGLVNAFGLLLPKTQGMGLHLRTSVRF